jgi:hypothetical protein
MYSLGYFDERDLALVAQALEVAEESVGDYFRLSDAAWGRYPYDLRTRAELSPQEESPTALAQVLRMRKPPVAGRLRDWDFYRICLQDHNLLELIRREAAPELMLPLVTYVLAHELVHVVRFYRFHHLFEADAEARRREEARVHAITSQALAKAPLPHMQRVLDLYQQHGGAGREPAWCM